MYETRFTTAPDRMANDAYYMAVVHSLTVGNDTPPPLRWPVFFKALPDNIPPLE